MKKPDSVIIVPGTIDTVFREWFEFLKPFHGLTDREMDVAAAIVKLRFQLSQSISNNDILDEIVMNSDSQKKVKEMCNITPSHFQVVMMKLRKSGIIKNGRINPRYIPNIDTSEDYFKMLLCFKLKSNEVE